jgi:hypothetical protein
MVALTQINTVFSEQLIAEHVAELPVASDEHDADRRVLRGVEVKVSLEIEVHAARHATPIAHVDLLRFFGLKSSSELPVAPPSKTIQP